MYRIVSKAFLQRGITKEQFISDETWAELIKSGKSVRYDSYHMPERKLKEVPEIKKPEEIIKTKKQSNG